MIVAPKVWITLYAVSLFLFCIASRIINKKIGPAWVLMLLFNIAHYYLNNRAAYMARGVRSQAFITLVFAIIGFFVLQSRFFIDVRAVY